jgi:hypothetical protein
MHSLSACLWWAVVCGAGAVPGGDVPTKAVDGKITWLHSYQEGKRLARESGKPLFVVFRCER